MGQQVVIDLRQTNSIHSCMLGFIFSLEILYLRFFSKIQFLHIKYLIMYPFIYHFEQFNILIFADENHEHGDVGDSDVGDIVMLVTL